MAGMVRGQGTEGQGRSAQMARYKVEAVSRAMLVLEALRLGPAESTVDALASRTGISRAATEATLLTLERRGLVQRGSGDPPVFRLGLGWLRLADVKRRQLDIREVALAVMRRMRNAVDETVSLSVRMGSNRVNIEYAESDHEVRRIVQRGFHVALHIGAGGRSLMSGMADEEVEAYLAPVALSQIEKSKLIAAIQATRRDGHAIVEGDVASDIAAISAPVRNHVGEVVAAVTISLPHERLTASMRARCIKEVMRGAGEISAGMGYVATRGG
jgi:DNA-binding IclR family transcriptional regulator